MCVKQSLQLHSHQMVSTQRWKLLLTAAGAALRTSVAFKGTLFRWFHFAHDTAWEAVPQTGQKEHAWDARVQRRPQLAPL